MMRPNLAAWKRRSISMARITRLFQKYLHTSSTIYMSVCISNRDVHLLQALYFLSGFESRCVWEWSTGGTLGELLEWYFSGFLNGLYHLENPDLTSKAGKKTTLHFSLYIDDKNTPDADPKLKNWKGPVQTIGICWRSYFF